MQDDRLCHNPNDDRPPETTHKTFVEAAKKVEGTEDGVDGIEQKTVRYNNGLTSHMTDARVLSIQYR